MRARLFHILTLFGSTAVAGPLGGADAESSGRWNQAPVERLVEYLAHERWETREAAERALLQRGMSAVEPLRSALSSENPELVRRVRYLLGRVDPTLGVFRVLRFELEPEPRVVEVAYYSGPPGENLVLRGERLVEPPDAAPRPSSDPRNARLRYASSRVSGRRTFRLSWWPLSDDEVEWTLQNATASRRGVSLPVLAPSGGIRLFEQGEESGYLRTGLVVDRQRQPYVVLVEQRLFRRSLNDALERPRDAAALRRTVVRALVEQGTRDHLDDRLAAIELVGLLRVEEGKELVERALDDPSTFPTAALSLAALRDPRGPALLRRVLREERALPEIRRRRQGNALRAAVELSRLGDADGLAFLVEELPKSDVFGLHALLSALVDRLPQIFDDDRLREDLLDVALNPDFLGRVSWNDPEVEYFLFRVLTSLDPDRPRDRMRAAGFQRGIERVASGEFPTARVSLARLRPLWSLAARAASETQESPDDETSLILAALAEGGRRRLSEVVREIRSVFADSPLPEPCFQRLLHRFRKALLSENPFEVTSATQQLVELSKSLRLAAGQL
ncbi:MAG: hypothetical protein O7J95_17740, partial [Planctomycetota bacterium]|nr:hypothetical protein [Planctomycetota bacterium]